MLRTLIKNFTRKLNFVIANENLLQSALQPCFKINFVKCLSSTEHLNVAIEDANQNIENVANQLDTDEYVIQYPAEKERKRVATIKLAEELQNKYRMSQNQIKEILIASKSGSYRDVSNVLNLLLVKGINKTNILENPWILSMSSKSLAKKIDEIGTLTIRDINDFVPFLRLSLPRLQKLVKFLNREANSLPCENRVYYISDKLGVEPKIVGKYLPKRLFMLQMPFKSLSDNLNNMVDFKIEPSNVLKDLWAFRYTPKSVRCRLERAKRAKKEKLMPWMVRCPERILQKSLQLSLDEKKLLGKHPSLVSYVASRIGYDEETTKAIMSKHPAVFKIRVRKIKNILDYLLNEAGFSQQEIAQVPRILSHGLETTKKRIEELKSYGCRPSSLVIVCRSKREYDKFLNNWISVREKCNKKSSEESDQK